MLENILNSSALYIGDLKLSNIALALVVILVLLLILILLREIPKTIREVKK